MQIYRATDLLKEDATFTDFVGLFGEALSSRSLLPFLLVRPDGPRLLVAFLQEATMDDGNAISVMLVLAFGEQRYQTSYTGSYVDDPVSFRGIRSDHQAKDENFIHPTTALAVIKSFFKGKTRFKEHVDFRLKLPDPDLPNFPTPLAIYSPRPRTQIEKKVDIPDQLRQDIEAVCRYLDDVAKDENENVDFLDAIQFGSLRGGREDKSSDLFLFTFEHTPTENWEFSIPRLTMDSIADGGTTRIAVTARIAGGGQ